MKKEILILLYFLTVTPFGFASELANDQFLKANSAYDSSNFEMAIQLYESLVSDAYFSDELHFNLGNAYFKSNEITLAILNYEKALKINPSHEDATYNLKLANAKTIDQIESIPELFLYRWWKSIFNAFSADGWATVCIGLFFLALVGFSVYFLIRSVWLRKVGFYSGMIAFSAALLSWYMAYQQNSYLESTQYAIIIEPTVNINSSPSEGSSKLFVLHEGTKVNVEEMREGWYKISIPNGNEGWVEQSYLADV